MGWGCSLPVRPGPGNPPLPAVSWSVWPIRATNSVSLTRRVTTSISNAPSSSVGTDRAPGVDEVLRVLERPEDNVVVNLLGMSIEDRPAFFEGLLPRLQELRVQTGRPHWIVVDEVHHLLPSTWAPASQTLPQELHGFLFIPVSREQFAPAALPMVDALIGIGESPDQKIRRFHETLGHKPAPSQ